MGWPYIIVWAQLITGILCGLCLIVSMILGYVADRHYKRALDILTRIE